MKIELNVTMPAEEILRHMRACPGFIAWVDSRTITATWEDCPCADWMLWFAAEIGIDRKLIVLAACDCARTVLPVVPAGDVRPVRVIEIAEAWTRGKASLDNVEAAIAHAAYAATAAAYAATAAAYAADAKEHTARLDHLRLMADLVRARIPATVVDERTIIWTQREDLP